MKYSVSISVDAVEVFVSCSLYAEGRLLHNAVLSNFHPFDATKKEYGDDS